MNQLDEELLRTLQTRFEKNTHRHLHIKWADVEQRLRTSPNKMQVLRRMEDSGGEPDVLAQIEASGEFLFADCAAESPVGRRSLCYDQAALDARKENKPRGSAIEMAQEIGIDILSEVEYRHLQRLGEFDKKTSSWVQTPEAIRKLGGALFCDRRYNQVFMYHNGAESYYAARGFRGRCIV
jgi:hypothetical protein